MLSLESHRTAAVFLLAVALSLVFLTAIANAQSAYFNVPTSDVMPKGAVLVEADFDAKLARFRDGGWHSFGVSGAFGLRRNVEVGVNAYATRSIGGFEHLEIQPNFKIRAYNNEDKGLTLAFGGIAYVPVKRNFGRGTIASAYVVGSKSFRPSWTPKLSAGGYQLLGASRSSGDRKGFLFAVEQPVHRRVTFIVDWNTGKNDLGYSAAGLGIALTKRSYLYSAYYFGNKGAGNNSLGIYYGFTF